MIAKRFLQWIGLKEKLHEKRHRAPYVSEGEMWWISFGENVGSEINGKSDSYRRYTPQLAAGGCRAEGVGSEV